MGRARSRVNKFVDGHALAWEVAMAALTLVYVVIGFIGAQSAEEAVSAVTAALSLVFLAEFSVRIWAATSRVKYLRGHWLDLVTCIPAVGPLRLFRMLRLVGIIRFASRARSSVLIHQRCKKGDALLGAWLVAPTLVLLWIGSGAGFWLLERGVYPHVTNFSDALFLAFITATTVGNSSIQPVTVEGQVLSGLVIFVGLGLLGFVSARLTAMWLNQENDSGQMAADLKSIKYELAETKELLTRVIEGFGPQTLSPVRDGRIAVQRLAEAHPSSQGGSTASRRS